MGKVKIEPDTLEHLVLYLAEDDWLPIGNASAHAADFESDIPKRKARLLAVIRALAAEGYLRVGDLEYRNPATKTGLHWAEWPGTLGDRMERLEEVYTPEVKDDKHWYYGCWLDLTEAGEQVLETLPAPDGRFFDGLI